MKHLIRITIILLMTFPVFGCGAFGISFGGVKTQPTTTTLEPNYYGMIAHAKWNHNPITYAVYGGDSSIPFINIRATVERGFNRWEKYMAPLGYSFVQVNPNRLPAPDVKVMIETAWDIAKETGSDPRNTDGDTELFYKTDGKTIDHVEMHILRTLTPDLMEAVCIHEWGHALGIRGHSNNSDDAMYPDIHLPMTITTSDANTITKIYSVK